MSKRKKTIRISPATALRPRLDNLWADRSLPHKDDAAIEGDLNAVARDVAPDFLVKTMLRAYLAAPERARARLDGVLPGWLREHGYLAVLRERIADGSLSADLRPQALAWLEASGVDTESLDSAPDLFFQAYYYDDAAVVGEKSQAYVAVFWYTNPKKKRAQGIAFLLDYNPPWDGSVKDVFVAPRRPPQRLLSDFLDVWTDGGMDPESVSAERAKTVILTALNCNRAAKIRLPRDLIGQREAVARHVLSLPDAPDTPTFTLDDFDFLVRTGKRPEQAMHFERTVGRRVRLEDGKEVLVMGGPDWEDEDW
jgi:hypothetical protein